MSNDLDKFLDNLQEQISNDAKEAFGENGFKRWQNPEYRGRMEDCDSSACLKGECGDTMEIFLKFSNNRVKAASYFTDGCSSSAICGSFTAELAHGKNPEEITEINSETVLKKIGKFPVEEKHCAFLAAETLQEALRLYMIRKVKKSS